MEYTDLKNRKSFLPRLKHVGFLTNLAMIKSSDIKATTSRLEKTKNNFKRQIDIADSYDLYYGSYRDDKRLEKFKINYDLANGRVDTSLYEVENEYCQIEGETVTISRGEIPHIPMISLVVKSLIGEQIARFWKLSVEDLGALKQSIQTNEFNKLLSLYIQNNIIVPREQAAYERVRQEMSQLDTSSMSPEELEQLKATIDNKVSEEVAHETPEDILNYMQNEYQNPIARQAQEVLDFLDSSLSLRDKNIEGFKHMIPTGEAYFYVNIEPRGLVFESIPPDSISFGGPVEKEWVQDMDWVKIEDRTTVVDIVANYGEILKPSHIKELDRMYEPKFGTSSYNKRDYSDRAYVFELTSNPEEMQERFGNQDWRLRENTPNIASAYAYVTKKFGRDVNFSDFGIRRSRIFWKEFRQMYRVFRLEDGHIKKFYFDEHYEPVEGDLEVKSIRAMEVWQCIKIGTSEPIYLEIKPLKGQYESNKDPYDVTLPVIGKKFNTFRNRTSNLSLVDNMKQFQRDYDTEMAALRRDLASNIGKVFVMMVNAKPKNMSWSDMLNIAKEHNLMLIDPVQRSGNGVDPQFLREVNMSKMSEISERVNLLNFILSNLYKVAGFNEYRIGQGGQYANRSSVEQGVNSSYNQTEEMFETYRKVVELAINKLLNIARLYYKDNIDLLRNILSPTSFMELENGYPFWYSFFNIKVENAGKVARQAEILKQNIQAFIQNGMEPKEVIHLALAESRNDIIDLVNKIDKRQQETMAAAQQQQQEQIMTQMEMQQQLEQDKREFLMAMEKMKLEYADIRSQRDSEKFRIANDVDKDGVSDLLEGKKLELEQRAKEHEDKMELARLSKNDTAVQARI